MLGVAGSSFAVCHPRHPNQHRANMPHSTISPFQVVFSVGLASGLYLIVVGAFPSHRLLLKEGRMCFQATARRMMGQTC